MKTTRSAQENLAIAAKIAVDAVVANALRAHGRDIVQTMADMLGSHERIGIDLLQFAVDIDLGYMAADGATMHEDTWEPRGRYRLGLQGLRSVSMPLTDRSRWVGAGRRRIKVEGRYQTIQQDACLVLDHVSLPESVLSTCVGRHVTEIVDHPWLRVEGLMVKKCTKDPAEHFTKIWMDEVLKAA